MVGWWGGDGDHQPRKNNNLYRRHSMPASSTLPAPSCPTYSGCDALLILLILQTRHQPRQTEKLPILSLLSLYPWYPQDRTVSSSAGHSIHPCCLPIVEQHCWCWWWWWWWWKVVAVVARFLLSTELPSPPLPRALSNIREEHRLGRANLGPASSLSLPPSSSQYSHSTTSPHLTNPVCPSLLI